MTNSDQHSDGAATALQDQAKCQKCGATMQLDTGVCVSCLLRKGLEGGDEVSQASYRNVLAEVDAPHKAWFLGNYEILEQIGCGGMGVIYRARQRHSQRIVAVKRVLSYRADSHGALQRFRREAQAVASLDHPNILPIYEVSESEDGLPFFSMKFAEKGSLHQNLASLRDQPRKSVELMAKVARAVEYAHSRGVLHRDIKPGNILLNDRSEPLVSDFGLAKLLDDNNDLTRSLTTFGTAGFIAPEQAGHAAGDFTPVADVYSLGAVLFTLLAGRPPFLGSNPVSVIRQASETQAPKLRSLVPSLDRDLETICSRCLERDPRVRYHSAGDLAADLERWLGGHPIVARPVSLPARMWRWSRRNPKMVGAATAGLLLGAAAVSLSGSMIETLNIRLGAGVSNRQQSRNNVDNRYLQGLFTAVPYPTRVNSNDTSVPVRNASNPFTVPDYTSPGGFDSGAETKLAAALPERAATTSVPDHALEPGTGTNKITANALAAPPETGFNISVRDRASQDGSGTDKMTPDVITPRRATAVTSTSVHDRVLETGPRTNKKTPDVASAPRATAVGTPARDRASEVVPRMSKVAADGAASIQGSVKDARGEPINGADVRIESRDGKQVFSKVKTDPQGRYNSHALRPGDYRVTLLVNGAVKASISNAQTKANQPTQLNFDFKPGSPARSSANGRKHVVWVPNRTGTHIGGNWVEVDDEGNPHFDSNVQTYSVRR